MARDPDAIKRPAKWVAVIAGGLALLGYCSNRTEADQLENDPSLDYRTGCSQFDGPIEDGQVPSEAQYDQNALRAPGGGQDLPGRIHVQPTYGAFHASLVDQQLPAYCEDATGRPTWANQCTFSLRWYVRSDDLEDVAITGGRVTLNAGDPSINDGNGLEVELVPDSTDRHLLWLLPVAIAGQPGDAEAPGVSGPGRDVGFNLTDINIYFGDSESRQVPNTTVWMRNIQYRPGDNGTVWASFLDVTDGLYDLDVSVNGQQGSPMCVMAPDTPGLGRLGLTGLGG